MKFRKKPVVIEAVQLSKPDIFEQTYEEARGEHVLSKDCWCNPKVIDVPANGATKEVNLKSKKEDL